MKTWNVIGKELVMMMTEGIKTGLKKGSQFITTQFPILCKQIITLGVVRNLFGMITWLILLGVSVWVAIFCYSPVSTEIGKADPNGKVFFLFPLFFGIAFSLTCIYQLYVVFIELSKAIFAPMIYIIEFMKEFSKGR